jgi:imidazolonepropionase
LAQQLLIRGARQLLTLRGPGDLRRGAALDDLGIIEDGSVLIRDGVISHIGSTRRLENLKEARAAAEIAVNGAVVMPGFVDPAVHFTPARDLQAKRASAADIHEDGLALMRLCLQHGTLNVQVKAGEGDSMAPDLTLLRQLAHIGDHPIGMVRAWRVGECVDPASGAYADLLATMARVKRRKLAQRIELAPRAETAVDAKFRDDTAAMGMDLNLTWSGGPAQTLAALLDRLQPKAVSCPSDISSAECEVLSRSSLPIVLSPTAALTQDSSGLGIRQLIEDGAPITLSSGYHTREMPVFNMQMAIALAVLRLGLRTEQAISAATVNAAHALGLGGVVGSLEVGKRADLLVLNLPNYRELPRRFGMNHVGMVIREGKIAFNRTGWKVSAA